MSYYAQWRRKAVSDTRAYWTTPRVSTTIAAPLVAATLWTIFKAWNGWNALMQIAVISVLGFFALWGIVFCINLILVPSRLEAEGQAAHAQQISDLRREIDTGKDALAEAIRRSKAMEEKLSRKHPHDVHRESQVRDALQKLDERERRFIGWLLDAGRVSRGRIQGAGFETVQEALNQKVGFDLITHEVERAANGVEIDRYHQINPSYVLALKSVLHPPAQHTGQADI